MPEDEESKDAKIWVDEEGKINIDAAGIKTPSRNIEYIEPRDMPRIFIGGLKNFWKNADNLSRAALLMVFFGWLPALMITVRIGDRYPIHHVVPWIIWVLAIARVSVVGDRFTRMG